MMTNYIYLGKTKNIKGFIGKLHVLLVVDGGDGELALGDIPVVQDVIREETLLLEVGNLIRHEVVESMVASL